MNDPPTSMIFGFETLHVVAVGFGLFLLWAWYITDRKHRDWHRDNPRRKQDES